MELRLALPQKRIAIGHEGTGTFAIASSIFSRRAMLAKGAAQRAGAERHRPLSDRKNFQALSQPISRCTLSTTTSMT
ncbi:hypothetical protein SAMD00079811_07610 [Scytonema sp. HK-05]|uniref:hypothetical protein n=1 Tax=Scytonema sp. HK-05 TaxID=1137095 RepID=UPI000B5EFB4A|nr:hypothetical protein [Scytonema sp. HK-05]BAY43182.1 hypothetical protein SAMD00079811_07610 [Scytonema sp. HK-05]